MKNKRDIDDQFIKALESAFGWKVRKLLISSLNRSIETINLMVGREAAIHVVWNFFKKDTPLPSKKIVKSQKNKLAMQLSQAKARNSLLIEDYKEKNPDELSNLVLQNHEYLFFQLATDKQQVGHAPWIPVNSWEQIGLTFVDGPKDLFLYDYLNHIDNFSNILLDENILMCTDYDGPPREMMGNFGYEHYIFCFLAIYAYIGILPSQVSREMSDSLTLFLPREIEKNFTDEDFLSYLLKHTKKSMNMIFDEYPPRFLQESYNAAEARFKLDHGLAISPTELSYLAGVNRKTIINAKLVEDNDSIPLQKAIAFLNGKARNRWTEDDEIGEPIGLKLIHSFPKLGMKSNFYPSVKKFT